MQIPDFSEDPSSAVAVLSENGHSDTPVHSTEPYVPPRIPLGLPHVVHFVEASLWHMPQTIRTVGERMSRYADKDGVVSISLPFLCEIAGLGSKNTAEHAITVMASMGVLAKHPGKGGKDRKSNTYTFLGEERNWRHLPAERRGTDPWIALSKSRRENEALRAENKALKAQRALLTTGHSAVTDGEGSTEPDGYESEGSPGTDEAIGHSGVPDGLVAPTQETASHSYDNEDSGSSPGEYGAIGHSKVTDGSDEGQEYLSRRGRVEALVMEHQGYYDRRFRGGVLSAIHHFSLNSENEDDLLRQVNVLRAGQEPGSSGVGAAQGAERPPPREETLTESGRREVEYCPDCGSPYTTFNGEERCPDCTGRRRRESEA